jgi:hypothetical protein
VPLCRNVRSPTRLHIHEDPVYRNLARTVRVVAIDGAIVVIVDVIAAISLEHGNAVFRDGPTRQNRGTIRICAIDEFIRVIVFLVVAHALLEWNGITSADAH